MEFNSLKKKTENDFNDYGIVYYREKRKLVSPPGYATDPNKRRKAEEKKTTISLSVDGSLLKMCFRYISLNLSILDSLVGMPEIIGKELFDFMLKNQILTLENVPYEHKNKEDENRLHCLMVFNEAFEDQIISNLSLKHSPKIMPYLSDFLICFNNVRELDLTGISLNDSVLSTFHNLTCLEILILAECGLCDFSIKKFSLPYRLFHNENIALEFLDLRDNKEITSKSLENLFVFPLLKKLNLSNTGIKKINLDSKKLEKYNFDYKQSPQTYKEVETTGWAKPIVEKILVNGQSKSSGSSFAKKTLSFYSLAKKKQEVDKQTSSSLTKSITSPIYLVRKDIKEQTSQKARSPLAPSSPSSKEGRTKKKKAIFFDEEDDEDNMLMQYSR
ncbi:leucine-rich repeat-containing protein 42-like isoform X3 [Clytia hemisphaerica]|uniref:Uncharacterized protein n=1 Tax=Clytia hemisphaerica TaxID=252671 RepID=A0A7M5WIR6_9CNID